MTTHGDDSIDSYACERSASTDNETLAGPGQSCGSIRLAAARCYGMRVSLTVMPWITLWMEGVALFHHAAPMEETLERAVLN